MTDTPIPMRLPCPGCGKLHIDEGEFTTKPHHTHSCQHCGLTWRPAVVTTVGVRFLPGFKDDKPGSAAPITAPITARDIREQTEIVVLNWKTGDIHYSHSAEDASLFMWGKDFQEYHLFVRVRRFQHVEIIGVTHQLERFQHMLS